MFVLEQNILVTSWSPLMITNPYSLVVFNFHGLHHKPPTFNLYDSILVVEDRLTKMTHFIPCTKTIISKGTTKLFLNKVFWYHGFLEDIISNRGP
jgi:hypothetical protein